jgi:hypothetical protein
MEFLDLQKLANVHLSVHDFLNLVHDYLISDPRPYLQVIIDRSLILSREWGVRTH